MFSLFSHKTKGKRNIIFDVQSGLVRVALVEFFDDREPVILHTITKAMADTVNSISGDRMMQKILKVTREMAEQIAKETKHHHVNSVQYALSSPWIVTELKTIKVKYEKKVEVNKKLIEKIIKEDAEKSKSGEGLVPIEQNIFEIRLNGYVVNLYEGRSVYSIDISLSTSYSIKIFIDELHRAVERSIRAPSHVCHSALLLQYRGLSAVIGSKQEYIYIHIHSEITDVIIVKDGLCKHISSYPFGVTTLVRKMSHATREDMDHNNSLLALYEKGELSETEKVRANRIIEPLLNAWSILCVKSFSDTFDPLHIPRTVYISAHSHFDIFRQALLFRNNMNFDIQPFGKASIETYSIALSTVL